MLSDGMVKYIYWSYAGRWLILYNLYDIHIFVHTIVCIYVTIDCVVSITFYIIQCASLACISCATYSHFNFDLIFNPS